LDATDILEEQPCFFLRPPPPPSFHSQVVLCNPHVSTPSELCAVTICRSTPPFSTGQVDGARALSDLPPSVAFPPLLLSGFPRQPLPIKIIVSLAKTTPFERFHLALFETTLRIFPSSCPAHTYDWSPRPPSRYTRNMVCTLANLSAFLGFCECLAPLPFLSSPQANQSPLPFPSRLPSVCLLHQSF